MPTSCERATAARWSRKRKNRPFAVLVYVRSIIIISGGASEPAALWPTMVASIFHSLHDDGSGLERSGRQQPSDKTLRRTMQCYTSSHTAPPPPGKHVRQHPQQQRRQSVSSQHLTQHSRPDRPFPRINTRTHTRRQIMTPATARMQKERERTYGEGWGR